jgi:hypothetical protein
MNTQAKFEVYKCKTLDVTNKKLILIARLTKNGRPCNGRKLIRVLINYGSEFTNNFFTDEFTFQLCSRPEKFACLSLKLRVWDLKN